MRYQPVKVSHITAFTLPKGTARSVRHLSFEDHQRLAIKTEKFWQVRSKLLGDCGHKHKTEAAAGRCLRRMKKRDTELRSLRSKLAHVSRKLQTLYANIPPIMTALPEPGVKLGDLKNVKLGPIQRKCLAGPSLYSRLSPGLRKSLDAAAKEVDKWPASKRSIEAKPSPVDESYPG